MDIQIDLRRGDFEGMHPKAKLFGFDEDKKLYTGDGVESINHQWTTWCACIGMLHLEVKEAQAVPEGYVLVPREMQWHKADDLACLEWGRHVGLFYSENRDMSALQVEEFRLRWCKNKANKIMSDYKAMIEAQEPAND